ncbi:MAG TPA: hypothetical protein VFW11_16345 [Cyclobacteriaceae bacterium]|nr:hypothetical protein [Cyclobacteriaceae bacterium]
MKFKFYDIVLLSGFLLLSPALFAQDGADPMEPEMKSSFMPSGESQKFDVKDSTYIRPSNTQPKTSDSSKNAAGTSSTKEEDDDVLSFNFLYYIIQKFKMSDIVDP